MHYFGVEGKTFPQGFPRVSALHYALQLWLPASWGQLMRVLSKQPLLRHLINER